MRTLPLLTYISVGKFRDSYKFVATDNTDGDRIFIRVYLWPKLVNHFIPVPVGFQHNLDTVVFLLLEDVVHLRIAAWALSDS